MRVNNCSQVQKAYKRFEGVRTVRVRPTIELRDTTGTRRQSRRVEKGKTHTESAEEEAQRARVERRRQKKKAGLKPGLYKDNITRVGGWMRVH
jgi:hypothetical protein